MRGCRLVGASVLTWIASTVLVHDDLAFNFKEHQRISNRAFILAVQKASYGCEASAAEQKGCGCLSPEARDALMNVFANCEAPTDYGRFVALTDYVVNPYDFVESAAGGYGELKAGEEAGTEYSRRLHNGLNKLRSGHNNEFHFQSELLATHWYLHQQATTLAAGRLDPPLGRVDEICAGAGAAIDRKMCAGLLINAAGDHLLEDFFAPGHILTPRATMHDSAAATMHDRFNVLGATFVVDGGESWQELKDVWDCPTCPVVSTIERALGMKDQISAIDSNKSVELWGDGDLCQSKSQEALMTLLVARSIEDVLQARLCKSPVNSFRYYKWRSMTRTPQGLEAAAGAIPQGRYQPQRVGNAFYGGGAIVIGYSSEYFFSKCCSEPGRGVFSLEYLASMRPPGVRKKLDRYGPQMVQINVAPGFQWVTNNSLRGYGPSGRLLVAIPRIDMSFSAEVGYRRYEPDDGFNFARTHYGLRGDLGFSLMTLHLGVERDHGRRFLPGSPVNEIRPGWAVRAGISFAAPFIRIPGTRQIVRAALKKQRKRWLSSADTCDWTKKK